MNTRQLALAMILSAGGAYAPLQQGRQRCWFRPRQASPVSLTDAADNYTNFQSAMPASGGSTPSAVASAMR